MARGHVRGGRKARHPSLLPHQARVRAGRPPGVEPALARLPAGDRRRRLAHRRDRQGRRPLLHVQAAPAGAAGAALLAADGRDRRRRDQHRPGRLRRRRDRPHRPPARPRRPGVPSSPTRTRRPPGELLNLFAKQADAPQARYRLDSDITDPASNLVRTGLRFFPPAKRVAKMALGELGIPAGILSYVNYPTHFDSTDAQAALEGSGIAVPPLETYADRIWDYWERNLDPSLFKDRSLSGAVRGKIVLDHRRLLGDRQSGRGQGRRRRRHGAARRPLDGQAGGDQSRDRAGRRRRPHPPLRHVRRRGRRADGRRGPHLPRPRRHRRQQRRPLDPPLGRARRRALPRLRADDGRSTTSAPCG